MASGSRPADTSPQAESILADLWRSRTPSERFEAMAALQSDAERIARAGIIDQLPHPSERAVVCELFRRRYGDELTIEVYGNSQGD